MANYICTVCQYEGKPKKTKRGSRGMEIFLWAVLLVPGPLYSIYRRFFLPGQCPNCTAIGTMASVNSDAGRLALHKLNVELGLVSPRDSEPVVMSDVSHATWLGEKDESEKPRVKREIDPDEW